MPQKLRESPTQALYRAALGPVQSEHHLRAFERFDELGAAAPSWNWAAALLTLNWLVYRRLWRMAGLYLALVLLAAGLLWGLAWGRLPDGVTLGLAATVAVLATVVPGLYGNAWLHGQLRLALVAAAREAPSLADTVDALGRRAPSLARLGALVLVNVLLGALVASGWLTGQAEGANVGASQGKPPAPSMAESAVPTALAGKPVLAPAKDDALALAPVTPVPSTQPLEVAPAAAAAPAALPGAPAPQVQHAPAPKPEPVANPAPAAPAPTSPVASAPEPAAAQASATVSGPYVINVGLFADPVNAERALARIRQAGMTASADTLALERGPRTRVRAGPFARRAEAERAAARIRALGLEARVVSPARLARPPG